MVALRITEDAEQTTPDNEDQRWIIQLSLKHVQESRELARALAVDARFAAEQGEGTRAKENLNAMFRLSEQIQETPFLITNLVAMSIQYIAHETLEFVCAEYPDLWSDEDLQSLAHTIATAKIDWQWALEGERIFFYDMFQRVYTDDGNGDGRFTKQGMDLFKKIEPRLKLIASRGTRRDGVGIDLIDSFYGIIDQYGDTFVAGPVAIASRSEMKEKFEELFQKSYVAYETPTLGDATGICERNH